MQKRIMELRNEIDEVNMELLKLLNHRTCLVKQISEVKDEGGIEYFDPEREKKQTYWQAKMPVSGNAYS